MNTFIAPEPYSETVEVDHSERIKQLVKQNKKDLFSKYKNRLLTYKNINEINFDEIMKKELNEIVDSAEIPFEPSDEWEEKEQT